MAARQTVDQQMHGVLQKGLPLHLVDPAFQRAPPAAAQQLREIDHGVGGLGRALLLVEHGTQHDALSVEDLRRGVGNGGDEEGAADHDEKGRKIGEGADRAAGSHGQDDQGEGTERAADRRIVDRRLARQRLPRRHPALLCLDLGHCLAFRRCPA